MQALSTEKEIQIILRSGHGARPSTQTYQGVHACLNEPHCDRPRIASQKEKK